MYIVFDLEHIAARKNKDNYKIIEIGAIKINNNLEVIDHFHSFVRPKNNFSMSDFLLTHKITGIDLECIKTAPSLTVVIHNFKKWIGNDKYFLCAWSGSDRFTLVYDCLNNNIDYQWIENYNDIQNTISKIIPRDNHRYLSLGDAVYEAFSYSDIQSHGAVEDAWFTALLFIEYFDRLNLQKNQIKINEMRYKFKYKDKEEFKNNPFEKLKGIFDE